MPPPDINFDGLANDDNLALVGDKVLPPDTNGDVGPNHYVQTTNLVLGVYDKLTGAPSPGFPVANNALWTGFDVNPAARACRDRNDGDPIVLYDHLAGRWLFSQFALPNIDDFPASGPFFQCIAVSTTGDPTTSSWYRYAYRWSGLKLNDYPKFGVWPDGYYMSVNQFYIPSERFGGVGVAVFERNKMLTGQSARMVKFDLEDDHPNLFGLLPADLDGARPPKGAPNPFASLDYDALGFTRNRLLIWQLNVNWSRPASSTFEKQKILSTEPFDSILCASRGCVPQPDTLSLLDPISDRLMYRLQYRNFGTHKTMVVNHTVDAGGRAGVRWYELRNYGSGWGLRQQGTFAPEDGLVDHHRWMGSVAMDRAGNIAVGYSVSSEDLFPSIRYAGRLARDIPRGELVQGEAVLHPGVGSQTHTQSRWGDYSMMTVDPTDSCTFWYTSEYYGVTSEEDWRTRVGSFAFGDECPDSVAPTAPSMAQPARQFQTARSFNLSWNASTDGGSGLAAYQIERRMASLREPLGTWKVWRHGIESLRKSHTGRPGRTYCFRTRGFDNAGNFSGRSDVKCTTLPVNDTALVHLGSWERREGAGYYLGTFSLTCTLGAGLLLEVVLARRLSVVATTCPACGTISTFWNGKLLKRISLTSQTRQQKRVLGLGDLGALRRGTLEIRVVSSGKAVIIEGAGVSRV